MFHSLGLQQVQKVKVGPGGWLVNCEQASYPSHGQPLIHVPKLFFNLAVSDVSVLPDLSSYHRNVMLFLPMANRSWTVLNSEAVRHFSSVVVNNRPFFKRMCILTSCCVCTATDTPKQSYTKVYFCYSSCSKAHSAQQLGLI